MVNQPTVVISILHIPHLNFFINLIKLLEKKGIEMIIIIRPRGRLLDVFKSELPNTEYILIGHHKSSFIGKIWDIIYRDIALCKLLKKIDFSVAISCGDHCLTHATRILSKPSISFSDDLLEYKMGYYLFKYTCEKIVIPDSIPISRNNVFKYKGSKQLSYLHPNYFTPKRKVLSEYSINENKYVFMREIKTNTLNYNHLKSGISLELCKKIRNKGYSIILSLEDKSKKRAFSKYCTLLEEPVSDIFSLMYFSAFSICSGDSVARECSFLGVPTIYLGGRNMFILQEMYDKKLMFNC